jgi:cobalt-zinc-cadmium efflux system membrane fusion protein
MLDGQDRHSDPDLKLLVGALTGEADEYLPRACNARRRLSRGRPVPSLGAGKHSGRGAQRRIGFYLGAALCFGAGLIALAAGFGNRGAWRPGGSPAQAAEPYAKVEYLRHDGAYLVVPEGSPLRSRLVVGPAAEKEIERTRVLPGVVEVDPARLVKIVPPVTGRVVQLKVQLGERVHANQELVVLDSSDLATAYAEHDRAKVLLELAQKNRDRQRELLKSAATALKDQQQAETDYITAKVELERTEERLRQIGVAAEPAGRSAGQSRMVAVISPISGSVIDLAAAQGAFWNDPTAALMTVADLGTVWVTASVPESDTALVTKGQSATVTFPAYPGEIFKGKVLFVSDVVDADTRRTRVRIPFQNPEMRLKPNMFASVGFVGPKQTLPVLPTTALVLRSDTDEVFVEVAPWRYEARSVEIGFQEGDRVVVKSGLKPGERVVVKGAVLLND